MERKTSTVTEKKGKKNFPLDEQNREFQLSGSRNFFPSAERNAKFKRKLEKSRYFHIKWGENKIFYSQWKSWKMCFNVSTRLGKLCCWMLIKKQGWKMKSFSISYLIFTGFWKMVTGHSRTLLCENESHVRMKIIVLSFKFSADLLLLMFVWDETGSAKKKNLFYMYSAIHLDH